MKVEQVKHRKNKKQKTKTFYCLVRPCFCMVIWRNFHVVLGLHWKMSPSLGKLGTFTMHKISAIDCSIAAAAKFENFVVYFFCRYCRCLVFFFYLPLLAWFVHWCFGNHVKFFNEGVSFCVFFYFQDTSGRQWSRWSREWKRRRGKRALATAAMAIALPSRCRHRLHSTVRTPRDSVSPRRLEPQMR